MDGESYKVDENEPTFDVDEWMTELTAGDQDNHIENTGMEAAGASFPFANANDHRNKEKSDEKFWPKTESKSDLFSGTCQTSMLTASNSDNFSGLARIGTFPSTSPMMKTGLSAIQFPQQTTSELELRQEVQESVFQPSTNQSNLNYQSRQEPMHFDHMQSSQQYMSVMKQKTSERWKVSNPSTSRPEKIGVNTELGSSSRQLDKSVDFQKFVVQSNNDLLHHPRIFSDSDVSIKPETMTSQQNLQQQVQRPMQFYHHLGSQNLRSEPSHGMQPKIQATSHSHGLILGGQLKPNQFPQRVAHEGSSALFNNMAQNGVLFPNFAEWHDHAYNQLLTMKRLYLAEVMSVYQKYRDLSTVQPPSAEYAIRVEKIRIFVEKIIKFLNMPRSDIVRCSKEKVYNYMNQITHFIYQNRSKLSVPSQYHQPIAQPQRLSQNRNINMPNFGSAPASIGPNRFVTGPEQSNARVSSSYISQQSSFSAIPHDRFNLGVPDVLQPCSTGLRHHNALSAALMNPSPNDMSGTYGSATRAAPSDSPVFQSRNLRNCEDRLLTQANKMKQPHRPLIDGHKQHMMGLRSGESMCSGTTMFQQPYQEKSQKNIDLFPHTVLSPSSSQPHVAPPQSGQCSSPQVDSNDISSKVSSGSVTFQSISSPFVVPSPVTPLTPSAPSIVDHVKKSSSHSPSLTSGEDSRAQNEPQAPENNCGAPDMHEVENSHLTTQIESEEVQKPNSENGPFKRLLEVVKSSSQKALNSALQDIGAVTNLVDRRAGAVIVDESRYIINQDLADEIRYSWQDNELLNLEHEVLPWPSGAFASFMCLSGENFDSESMASSKSKKLKTEVNDLLMKEIKEVNMRLLETVAEIVVDKTGFSRDEGDEETIIHCSYFPVGQFATAHVGFPGLQLRLLVNRDYPQSSPRVLGVIPHNYSETEEVQAITQKAKSKFSLSLREFSEPLSVSVMVKAWDVTAREVYHECAKKLGGECFSSRYGGWKDCVTAA